MAASLDDGEKAEADAAANHKELMAAKSKEVETLQAQIEDKSARVGNLGVEIAEMGNDVEDTSEALAADEEFLKELDVGCKTKAADWEKVKKSRAEELLALAETIKVLNDDEALDLFKKTLPSAASASFVQLQVTKSAQRAQALAVLRSASRKARSPNLDFIALALNGKAAGFEKVLG